MTTNKSFTISFEVFPPNTAEGVYNLNNTCMQLNLLQPDYFSVTFGAGGASQQKTKNVVNDIAAKQIQVCPHISCINTTTEDILNLLAAYKHLGIKRLVVIRGDLPATHEKNTQHFYYANELVEFIRSQTGAYFHLTVAAYPEFHPQAACANTDFENFKRKVIAGANSAITQFFFNIDSYFRFVEHCHQLDIHVPIIPGIMPISDYNKLLRFAGICGAEVPLWLRKRMETFHDDQSRLEFGVDVVTHLCEKLRDHVPGLHFYTLNHVEPTRTILRNLNLIKTDKKIMEAMGNPVSL